MAQGSLMAKLHYSSCDIKNIESFLDFSVAVFKDL